MYLEYLVEIDVEDEVVFVPLRVVVDLPELPEQSAEHLKIEYEIIQRLKREEDKGVGKKELLTLEEEEKLIIGSYIDRLRPGTNWEEIAEILGIAEKTLWKKRKKYGFD